MSRWYADENFDEGVVQELPANCGFIQKERCRP
jgi:hypothetical protein